MINNKQKNISLYCRADKLLRMIAETKAELDQAKARAVQEINAIKVRYAKEIAERQIFLNESEDSLIAEMKTNKTEWFRETDQIELMHGFLLYGRESKVTIPRNALAQIEDLGWLEAIKIAKSVDRGVVETWPLERLVQIGADRKEKELFSYELKTKNVEKRN